MAHQHKEKTYRIVGYQHSIPGAVENRRAHGGVCILSTCSCGAERKTNSNGNAEERGPWLTTEELSPAPRS